MSTLYQQNILSKSLGAGLGCHFPSTRLDMEIGSGEREGGGAEDGGWGGIYLVFWK